ncbi:MAG: nitroreductase family protein [Patescibacteria group bacterium]
MEFQEVLKKRHCLRKFDPESKVPDELIEKLIEAGHSGPSAGNLHPEDFIIIHDQETKEKLAEAALGQMFVAEAPVVIVVIADVEKTASCYGERGRNLYVIQDAAAATENIFLTATDLGLGMCWVGAFDEKQVQKILQLKPEQRPLAILPVGYKQ